MLIGPVFSRELVTAPRRMAVLCCAGHVCGGFVGADLYRLAVAAGNATSAERGGHGAVWDGVVSVSPPLQLVLAIFFSAMASASAVAQEKDRRTLELLLLTNLSNSELVLGKLLASLLSVLMLLVAGLPFFMLTALFGGVSFEQILRVFAVTVINALAAGSLGSMIALWREKTFQTLAMTALVLAVLAGWEVVVASGAWQGVPICAGCRG